MSRLLQPVTIGLLLFCSSSAIAQQEAGPKPPLVMADSEYVVPSIPLDPIPRKKPARPSPRSSFVRVGFQFGTTRTRADQAQELLDKQGNSFVLGSSSMIYATDSDFTFRQGHGFRIGGGSAGFDGALNLDTAGGMRLRVGQDHGPFLRIGARGQVSGNKALYTSYVEIPQAQLGYQNMSHKLHWEIAMRTGMVLVGRYRIGSMGSRRTGSAVELGGYGALNLEHVKVETSFTRIDVGQPQPVDEFSLALCGVAQRVSICTDLRLYQGDIDIPYSAGESAFVRASYAGFFVGGGYGTD